MFSAITEDSISSATFTAQGNKSSKSLRLPVDAKVMYCIFFVCTGTASILPAQIIPLIPLLEPAGPVSYTHLTLPTTPYV